MPLAPLRRILLLALLASAVAAAVAAAAVVEVNGLVLRADGGFEPQTLPRHGFAPIHFQGHFSIAAKDGGAPPALQQAVIDFDRNGHIDVTGLPSCPPQRIAEATVAEARRLCHSSIVGTGTLSAVISLASGPITATSPLTIFNGPEEGGHPTAVLHARTTQPGTQTYAIVVPIEREHSRFGYRVTINVPPIAAGYGALTRVAVKIGRRFTSGGRERSYVSARCTDNVLQTHGRFTFSDGTIIDGSVEKYCRIG